MTKALRVTTGSEVPSVPSVYVLVPALLCLLIRTLLHDLGNHVHCLRDSRGSAGLQQRQHDQTVGGGSATVLAQGKYRGYLPAVAL